MTDPSSDKFLAPAGRLVVEEDATAGEHVVVLSIVHRRLMSEDLGDAIEVAWAETASIHSAG